MSAPHLPFSEHATCGDHRHFQALAPQSYAHSIGFGLFGVEQSQPDAVVSELGGFLHAGFQAIAKDHESRWRSIFRRNSQPDLPSNCTFYSPSATESQRNHSPAARIARSA